jgi:Pentapeptide repeats (8 copies)
VVSRRVPWRTVFGWFGLLVVAAVAVVAGVYVVFWPVSDLIARHDVGAITGPHRAAALQVARDAARGRLLTFGAGVFAAGALVYTARNFSLSREGQVTDRYTRAIEQLGSDKLDVRIGGIYALERVARDSPRDHPTVMEVLAAFIREHSREMFLEVRAAATVIGRRNPKHDRQPVNLDGAKLTTADLSGAYLSGAFLVGADLTHADLSDADLTRAYLSGANLSGANLIGADLARANLIGADLSGADLTSADLIGADLTGADLIGADLTSADLTRANLTRANLSGANLTRALLPPDAVVPEGWQRDPGSGQLKQAETNSGGAPTDAAPGT